MGARSKARKRALDVLYEADIRGDDPLRTLTERADLTPPIPEYAGDLVRGVCTYRERIDELISSYAEGWQLERMPVVDRAVLRIAIYELLWQEDVPNAVAINEAVELAKQLSTDSSPRFVNGVLARLARAHQDPVG